MNEHANRSTFATAGNNDFGRDFGIVAWEPGS